MKKSQAIRSSLAKMISDIVYRLRVEYRLVMELPDGHWWEFSLVFSNPPFRLLFTKCFFLGGDTV